MVIGADFNGHIGEGNRGGENVMGRYGDKARNAVRKWTISLCRGHT